MKFKEWLRDSTTPPNIPLIQTGPVGNQADSPSTRIAQTKVGDSGKNRFKSSSIEMLFPRPNRDGGLGNLGMKTVSDKTFTKVGENPTLVNGIPV